MRVALYARYSSDHQREASIEDQLRLCRIRAESEGWTVVDSYSDKAISGASMIRPGIQSLMRDALAGKFDIVIAEAMDRLSRDQEDIAGIYKRLSFAGVRIITLSEGDISDLHVGLKGTMNALFLKDLADKTRRGLRGRVEAGKSGGGKSYGYDIPRAFDAHGELIRGERTINKQQALIINRIFREYSEGLSPRKIAHKLNADHIAGPEGRTWNPSTINGNRNRGTGILNNELYIGRMVWNRLNYIKNPDTGKRVSRLNPKEEWIIKEVPELAIIDQALWSAVKARQDRLTKKHKPLQRNNALGASKRPAYLLSGLTTCGCCGGGYSMISQNLLGCSNSRNRGKAVCSNRINIRRDTLESTIITALQKELMQPELFKDFSEAYRLELNNHTNEQALSQGSNKQELAKVTTQIDNLVTALKNGISAETVRDELQCLEARKDHLTQTLMQATTPEPILHPAMTDIYHVKLKDLHSALTKDTSHTEAKEAIRALINEITLTPEGKELHIVLKGDIAGILTLASGKEKPTSINTGGYSDLQTQVPLVAGVGFEPTTFRL